MRAQIRYLRDNEMLLNPLDYYQRRVGKLAYDLRWCYTDFDQNKLLWQDELAATEEDFRTMEYSFLKELDAVREGIHA
jgi:hypothetical protein